jgi:hypothetical protein
VGRANPGIEFVELDIENPKSRNKQPTRTMPLREFIDEAIKILLTDAHEVLTLGNGVSDRVGPSFFVGLAWATC